MKTDLLDIALTILEGLKSTPVGTINPSVLSEAPDREFWQTQRAAGHEVFARTSTFRMTSKQGANTTARFVDDIISALMKAFHFISKPYLGEGREYGCLEGTDTRTEPSISRITDAEGRSSIAVVSNNEEFLQAFPIDEIQKALTELSAKAEANEPNEKNIAAAALGLIQGFKKASALAFDRSRIDEEFASLFKPGKLFALIPDSCKPLEIMEGAIDILCPIVAEELKRTAGVNELDLKGIILFDWNVDYLKGNDRANDVDRSHVPPSLFTLLYVSADPETFRKIPWNTVEAEFRKKYPEAGPKSPWARGGTEKPN